MAVRLLKLMIPESELFNEKTNEFFTQPALELELEHSLFSLSKWESVFEKPFLGPGQRTVEETVAYIECMCLTPDIPSQVFLRLSNENITAVNVYIDKKMTATWFRETPGQGTAAREIITAEIIYYWMIALSIPFECQHWHLNRLLTLVQVCNQKNQPQKKISRRELAERNRTLNAQRKAQLHTNG